MSGPTCIDSDVKHWRPRLIELTTIPNAEVANGEPQKAYVDPSLIALVYRAIGKWNAQQPEFRDKERFYEVTQVVLYNGHHLSVLESPEEVNRRRDLAYGIEAPRAGPIAAPKNLGDYR